MTPAEKLDQLNTAIAEVEGGAQEYRFRDRTVRKADLAVLYKERREVERILAQEDSGTTYVAAFMR